MFVLEKCFIDFYLSQILNFRHVFQSSTLYWHRCSFSFYQLTLKTCFPPNLNCDTPSLFGWNAIFMYRSSLCIIVYINKSLIVSTASVTSGWLWESWGKIALITMFHAEYFCFVFSWILFLISHIREYKNFTSSVSPDLTQAGVRSNFHIPLFYCKVNNRFTRVEKLNRSNRWIVS